MNKTQQMSHEAREIIEQVYDRDRETVLMLSGGVAWAYIWFEAGHLYGIQENLFGFEGPRRVTEEYLGKAIDQAKDAEFVNRSETAAEELILNAR